MRRILVTGANKGIGLAIAEGILREHADTFLVLGSRDPARGRAALEQLCEVDPAWSDRAFVVELDVASDDSVDRAARVLEERLGTTTPLYGLVNNAGVGLGHSMRAVFEVNTAGVRRVCERFLPLLDPNEGRIVNVTSASGPSFVSKCTPERQRFFLNTNSEWADIETLMNECVAIEGQSSAFAARGLGEGDAYGLSKACANTYTLQLARRHPELRINACTPGFIETDLTRHYAESANKSPSELGMKSPREGARCPLKLLFGDLEGNGRYYGSDGKRSPLDRYRSPGSPAYIGD